MQVKSGAKCAVKGLTTRENQHTEAPRKSKRAPKVNVLKNKIKKKDSTDNQLIQRKKKKKKR